MVILKTMTAQRASQLAMKKPIAREYFESLVIAVILALFARTWIFQSFQIPSGSMERTLLVGDHLIVNKVVFAPTLSGLERAILPIRPIQRGDVLVFKNPPDPTHDLIKRVIGLPGERVELHQKHVYIDGQLLDDPWAQFLPLPVGAHIERANDRSTEFGPVTVPADQYFMMGDNRDNSADSRYWGFMPKDYVKGRAEVIYFSIQDGEPLSPVFSAARRARFLQRVR
jgi:signal peptidase I